jgi:preprotein translocase subunit Sss1
MNSLEKNLRPIPRTWNEAKRNATYATSITRYKSDAKETIEFLAEAFLGFVYVGLIGGAIFVVACFIFDWRF